MSSSWPFFFNNGMLNIFIMQIDFNYYANTDLLIAFSCDRVVSHRYLLIMEYGRYNWWSKLSSDIISHLLLWAGTSTSSFEQRPQTFQAVSWKIIEGASWLLGEVVCWKLSTLFQLPNHLINTTTLTLLAISHLAVLHISNFSSSQRWKKMLIMSSLRLLADFLRLYVVIVDESNTKMSSHLTSSPISVLLQHIYKIYYVGGRYLPVILNANHLFVSQINSW